ncbi:MAG: DUF4335 domain-containing protein, partial [Leptolyngbyaceae cyanobacterium bins.59]|nr:DUF4335 domain-containing protein [Leptolyngbyaceae cyanobacterium bins.59]
MSSRYAVRQYTPPTCTLEVIAQESALSRWVGRPVLKHLRFQLSFDAPQQHTKDHVVIRGDRADLEALHAAVEDYVQTLLTHETQENSKVPPFSASQGISLHPQGLLNHELTLGSLARDSISTVRLSTLQLSDLATALDEFASEADAIPHLNRGSWLQTPPAWLRAAAAIVIAVGVTTATIRWSEQSDPALQNVPSETAQLDSRRASPPQSFAPSPAAPPPASPSPAPPSPSASKAAPVPACPNPPPP